MGQAARVEALVWAVATAFTAVGHFESSYDYGIMPAFGRGLHLMRPGTAQFAYLIGQQACLDDEDASCRWLAEDDFHQQHHTAAYRSQGLDLQPLT